MLADTQIAIVGGGPAGLATALELRRMGHDALVVDRAKPPIDKACGEGLMPDGFEALQRLGVHLAADRWQPFWGIRYLDGELQAEARFPEGSGAGVRRVELHRAMVERAETTGVRTLWGVTVRGLDEKGLQTDKGWIQARWIVGADGLHSRVRKWAGLSGRRPRIRRFGIRRHYKVTPWTDFVEVYWAEGCEAYVTPVSTQQIGVAILRGEQKADFDHLLANFPSLARRLAGAEIASRDKGVGRLEQHSRAVYSGPVALVGDAAGYRDAITGEGLSMAFLEAHALATAIDQGRLDGYGPAVRKLSAFPFLLIRLLLAAERRPQLRHRMVRTLAAEPALFARILAIHARKAPARSVGAKGVFQLARGLLG